MSQALKQKQRSRLAAEINLGRPGAGHGGQLSVCLVSPSRYRTGMSSLGFQTVYALLSEAGGIRCERAFLPDRDELEEYRRSGTALLSLESQRPLADFDVIAFSTSFEPDYLNIPIILKLARLFSSIPNRWPIISTRSVSARVRILSPRWSRRCCRPFRRGGPGCWPR